MRTNLTLTTLTAALFLASAASQAIAAPASNDKTASLVAVLQSGASQKEKADACRELAVYGTPEAIPALVPLLSDEKLSHMARYALETMPGAAVDKALREALGRLNGRPLLGVIVSLGVRHDAKAVPALSGLLKHADAEVGRTAAKALGDIGTSAAAAALQKALPGVPPESQLAFCEGLLRCADGFASKGQKRKAYEIYDALSRYRSSLHQVRTAALRGSVLMAGKSGTTRLVEGLRSPDFGEFLAAARVSQEIRGAAVTDALVKELPKSNPDKQVVLLQALGKRADATALPEILTAARTYEKPVRIAAIRAVGELGVASATPTLVDLMFQPDREIAQAAQESLAGLPGTEVDAAVLSLLSAADPTKHSVGLDLVARRRMMMALPVLLKDASHADAKIRSAALSKIGELAGPDQVPSLLDLLYKAKDASDLEGVEHALGAVCLRANNPDSCVEKLGSAMAKAGPAQTAALVRVVASLGGPSALNLVRKTMDASQPEVRSAAVRSLGSWSGPEAAPVLLAAVKASTDDTEKMLLLRGYLRLAGSADVPEAQRLAMCKEASGLVRNSEEKKLLMGAVGNLNSLEGLSIATAQLGDSEVKNEAGTAVLNIAERLLNGDQAKNVASQLVEPLGKVAQSGGSLGDRANKLLEKARKQ